MTETKTCTKCGEEKLATNEFFHKHTLGRFGLRPVCKLCRKNKVEKPKPPEGFKECSKCKEYKPATTEFFAVQNFVKCGLRSACKLCEKRYCAETNEQKRISSAKYYEANKEHITPKRTAYEKHKRKVCSKYRLGKNMRNMIRKSFNTIGIRKNSRTVEILGCDIESFKIHIEKQFTDGMNWERFSEIHIDHIVPLATAKTEEDVIRLNHYTNLRPLWAIDNLKKGAKLDYII